MSGLDSIRAINDWAASPECQKLMEGARKAEKERTEREQSAYRRTEASNKTPSGNKRK